MQKYRKAYYTIKRALEHHNVVILIGLRKTGKTTILKQLAGDMNGMYIDFRSDSNEGRYLDALNHSNNDLLLLDEVCYMQDFDLVLRTADFDCGRHNKKLVLTSLSYGSLSQVAVESLGGGRSCVVELFPLSFEEYLYFSGKIFSYGERYVPSETDVENFYRLEGIPTDMRFTLDVDYLVGTIKDADVAIGNQYYEYRGYTADVSQVRAVLDLIAYTLNYKINIIRFGSTKSGIQEYSADLVKDVDMFNTRIEKSNNEVNINSKINKRIDTMLPVDVANIILFLLHNGFLFVDLIRSEVSRQKSSEAEYDLVNVYNRSDLDAVLKKYTFSAISPLLYTRLLIDLESVVGYPATNSHLKGELYELAVKSEDIYNSGFNVVHSSEKVRCGKLEVDLLSYDGLLLESSVSAKDTNNLMNVFRDLDIIRVLTRPVDNDEVIIVNDGYYSIQYPTALLMLSNKSMYDLDTSLEP